MNTNVTLPDVYFSPGEEVKWWLTSLPPYYCQNASTASVQDFSTDNTWLGCSMFDSMGAPTNVAYTSGIKFAFSVGDLPTGTAPQTPNDIKYITNAAGTQQDLLNLNRASGTYNANNGNWGLQDTYKVGGIGKFVFGPYDLNKTTDTTPYPAADGDIIIVTTGSDTLYTNSPSSEQYFGPNDLRIFNLLFYSTGSNEAQDLVRGVFGNNAASAFQSYGEADRYTFQTHADVRGSMSFVAIPAQNNPSNLMWWPITWSDGAPRIVQTMNDA